MIKKELEELLKKEEYLTSDKFKSPDREYIYMDKKNNTIKIMKMGDITLPFDFNDFSINDFRTVVKKYNNLTHLNEY